MGGGKNNPFQLGMESSIGRTHLANQRLMHDRVIRSAKSVVDTSPPPGVFEYREHRRRNPRWLLSYQDKEDRKHNDEVMRHIKHHTAPAVDSKPPARAMAYGAWRQTERYTLGGLPRPQEHIDAARKEYERCIAIMRVQEESCHPMALIQSPTVQVRCRCREAAGQYSS